MPAKLDIMVVDDNPDVLSMLREILTLEDYQVRTFADGASAIDAFCRRPADLVITDLGMPEVSGWMVAEAIREVSTQTPIVFITAVGEPVDPVIVRQLGVHSVLRKPFKLAQIREILRNIS